MQKELAAFQAYECMEEYDKSEALTQVAARKILPMLAVTTKKPVEGSGSQDKRVYSQVPRGHVRAALNLASRMRWAVGVQGVSTAFLNSELTQPVWAYLPKLFVRAGLVGQNKIAPQIYLVHEVLNKSINEGVFDGLECVYVDDLLHLGPSALVASLEAAVGQLWKVTDGGVLEPYCTPNASVEYLGKKRAQTMVGMLQ
eukprot:4141348-Amphidinium_carterae.1